MQFFELGEVVEHCFHNGVNDFFGNVGARYKGCTYTEGINVFLVVVHARWNSRVTIERVLLYKGFNSGPCGIDR